MIADAIHAMLTDMTPASAYSCGRVPLIRKPQGETGGSDHLQRLLIGLAMELSCLGRPSLPTIQNTEFISLSRKDDVHK